ncbi:MAG TPA: hypothetical protein VF719_01860, partial [Abditibacteriaceae bacterium]
MKYDETEISVDCKSAHSPRLASEPVAPLNSDSGLENSLHSGVPLADGSPPDQSGTSLTLTENKVMTLAEPFCDAPFSQNPDGRRERRTKPPQDDARSPKSTPEFLADLLTPSTILHSGELSEADRESAYQQELFLLFQQRLRLVAGLGMLTLPCFAVFYLMLVPAMAQPLLLTHAVLFGVCAAIRTLATRTKTLGGARLFS